MTLSIEAGPPTVLMGPNGSGKTTLIKLAMGLLKPTAGHIQFAQPSMLAHRHAMVFQKPVMLRRSAASNIAFALKAANRSPDPQMIYRLLERVGLGALAARPARSFRAASNEDSRSLRALARDPELLFLDEPTTSLDPAATKAVEDIIARTAESGVKVVMATHDLGRARPARRRYRVPRQRPVGRACARGGLLLGACDEGSHALPRR